MDERINIFNNIKEGMKKSFPPLYYYFVLLIQ